jgi:hypothetical protein
MGKYLKKLCAYQLFQCQPHSLIVPLKCKCHFDQTLKICKKNIKEKFIYKIGLILFLDILFFYNWQYATRV